MTHSSTHSAGCKRLSIFGLSLLAAGLTAALPAQTVYTISQPLESGSGAVVNRGRGQSFTVSAQGQGTGSLAGATQVRLDSVTFRYGVGFQAAQAAALGSTLHVYASLPSVISDLTTGTGALFTSTSASASGIEATHFFSSALLDTTSTYYLFYNADRQFRYSFEPNPYSGGRIWYRDSTLGNWVITTGGADQLDAYFVISTTVIPEPASFGILAGFAVLGWCAMRRRRA